MLYRIFHDGLQGQRRQAEADKGRIVRHDKHIVVLGLFYGQVRAGVLQLRGEGDGAVTGDGVEVPAQIIGKIDYDLPGLLRIQPAEAVDGHKGIVDKVGAHLQHHNAGALMGNFLLLEGNFPLLERDFLVLEGDFPLMAAVLFNLVGQDEAVHGQGGEDIADVDEGEKVEEQLRDHSRHDGQYRDKDQRNVLAHLHFVTDEDIRRMAETGSIEFGKLANMTVFDCDFLHDDIEKVAQANVIATIVDGEEVYKA